MEYAMNGTQRHRELLNIMRQASTPLSGGASGKKTGVGRQVVVRDITFLRTIGYLIFSTARRYVLSESEHASRLFEVRYTNEQIEDELVTIVDLSRTVADVMVNHRVYGKMSTPLNIKNRRDVQLFVNSIQTRKPTLLMNIISGYRFHHVYAEREEILDEIEEALRKKHYLAGLLSYEMSDNK